MAKPILDVESRTFFIPLFPKDYSDIERIDVVMHRGPAHTHLLHAMRLMKTCIELHDLGHHCYLWLPEIYSLRYDGKVAGYIYPRDDRHRRVAHPRAFYDDRDVADARYQPMTVSRLYAERLRDYRLLLQVERLEGVYTSALQFYFWVMETALWRHAKLMCRTHERELLLLGPDGLLRRPAFLDVKGVA